MNEVGYKMLHDQEKYNFNYNKSLKKKILQEEDSFANLVVTCPTAPHRFVVAASTYPIDANGRATSWDYIPIQKSPFLDLARHSAGQVTKYSK